MHVDVVSEFLSCFRILVIFMGFLASTDVMCHDEATTGLRSTVQRAERTNGRPAKGEACGEKLLGMKSTLS